MEILVAGAGSLGAHLVEHLTRTRPHWPLRVLDFDRVEERNLRNQPYFAAQVGKLKVTALAELVLRISGVRIQTLAKKLTSENAAGLIKGAQLVLDCLDNHNSRQALQEAVRKQGQECLHLGLASDYGEVIWDGQYRVPPDTPVDPCADPLGRHLALSLTVLFEKVLGEYQAGRRRSFCQTMGDGLTSELFDQSL